MHGLENDSQRVGEIAEASLFSCVERLAVLAIQQLGNGKDLIAPVADRKTMNGSVSSPGSAQACPSCAGCRSVKCMDSRDVQRSLVARVHGFDKSFPVQRFAFNNPLEPTCID